MFYDLERRELYLDKYFNASHACIRNINRRTDRILIGFFPLSLSLALSLKYIRRNEEEKEKEKNIIEEQR